MYICIYIYTQYIYIICIYIHTYKHISGKSYTNTLNSTSSSNNSKNSCYNHSHNQSIVSNDNFQNHGNIIKQLYTIISNPEEQFEPCGTEPRNPEHQNSRCGYFRDGLGLSNHRQAQAAHLLLGLKIEGLRDFFCEAPFPKWLQPATPKKASRPGEMAGAQGLGCRVWGPEQRGLGSQTFRLQGFKGPYSEIGLHLLILNFP